MRHPVILLLLLGGVAVQGQFGSLSWGSPSNIGPPSRPQYGMGKPPGGPRPGPYSGGPPGGGGGGPFPSGSGPSRGDYNEDPIPPMADSEGSYDTQQLPSKLPILAPNGVVEIYNRVVDDLLRKLEGDLQKKELDPMPVVIRPTPPGPVRVPGYLQKRPFRRPGAALYRSTNPTGAGGMKKKGRSGVLPPETRFGDRPSSDGESSSVRGAGKISKVPLNADADDDEKEINETTASSTPATTTTVAAVPAASEPSKEDEVVLPSLPISSEERGSSEEDTFMKPRSDEFFPEPEEEEEEAPKAKKEKKDESEEIEEAPEEDKNKEKDVDSLIQHYQSKNAKHKDKYAGKKNKGAKPVVVDPADEDDGVIASLEESKQDEKLEKERKVLTKSQKKISNKSSSKNKNKAKDESEEDDEDDEPEQRDDHNDEEFDGPPEPGTGGGKRPNGGYYPPGGPPAVPAKPNAELSGLARIRRASDVSVSVDARSAVITARLLVGPINVVINESQEPMEKNVKATIPELEAELLLMERHGVVFLQRFTLDRAYGQDVEISIPKSKDKKKKQSSSSTASNDPNHPMNIETRRQTKMAAHVSMEVVKLLRSGNLRVNLMRTAQGAMSKLKLPIKKAKNGAKKSSGSSGSKKNKKDKGKGKHE